MTHANPGATRRPFLMRAYAGPCYYAAVWGSADLVLIGRPDLMTHASDEGRLGLAAFAVNLIVGPTMESMDSGRWWRWVFRLWIRSDAAEIAQRLAVSDDGREATMLARARAFFERRPLPAPLENPHGR